MPFASARHSLMLVLPTSKRSAVRECVMAATFTSLRRKFKGGRCSLPRIGVWTSGSRVRAGWMKRQKILALSRGEDIVSPQKIVPSCGGGFP